MSLKNLQLNPYNIIELYHNSLISSKKSTDTDAKQINILGNNLKKISILLYDEDNYFIDENDLLLLTKMLTACKLTIEDTAIINIAKTSINIETLIEKLHPAKAILFGVHSAQIQLPIIFPEYKVQEFKNIAFLSSISLKNIADNKSEKEKLWLSLQQLFGIIK